MKNYIIEYIEEIKSEFRIKSIKYFKNKTVIQLEGLVILRQIDSGKIVIEILADFINIDYQIDFYTSVIITFLGSILFIVTGVLSTYFNPWFHITGFIVLNLFVQGLHFFAYAIFKFRLNNSINRSIFMNNE